MTFQRISFASAWIAVVASCAAGPQATAPVTARPVEPASDGGYVYARTPTGLVVVVNETTTHLTLQISGTDIRRVDVSDHLAWMVDGQMIELQLTTPEAIYGRPAPGIPDKELLLAHFQWEAQYIKETLGARGRGLDIGLSGCKTEHGLTSCVWGYEPPAPDVPGMKVEKVKNIFLTTVVGNNVVALWSPVTANQDPAAAEARLRAILATYRPSDRFIDPKVELSR